MKKQLQVLLLASFALPCTHLQANSTGGIYIGADYSYGNIDITFENFTLGDDLEIESNPSLASITVGTNLTTNFALEARLGIGISDDTVTVSIGNVSETFNDVTADIDSYYGLFAKYSIPINDVFSLHGTVGYTEVELTFTNPDGSVSDDDSDFSLGFGGTFSLNQQLSVNVEYISLNRSSDDDSIDSSVGIFNIGLKYSL